MRVTWPRTDQLEIKEVSAVVNRKARRGLGANEATAFPPEFLQSKQVSLHQTLEVSMSARAADRRGDTLPEIPLDIETSERESALVVLRHPSQALTLHAPLRSTVRGAKGRSRKTLHFRIPLGHAQTIEGRRGLVSQVIKATVLRVARPLVDKIADFALPKLARFWEERAWAAKGLKEGWFRVVLPEGKGSLRLQPEIPDLAERSLLFLHGTFSNATSAFGGLINTDFFAQVQSLYGDRIFAFNHFTVSRSPAENAEALLSALPDKKRTFDVITHSRGGLVLRTLVESHSRLGRLADRFELGRAVLVASPNDGTPLATPERWEKTVGWFANLTEIVGKFAGENPFITATEFVSEAIVWLAHHVSGDLAGLRAMDARGETISSLQGPPAPPEHAYSALASNFQPDQKLWLRIVDVGVDQFFAGANDLVVPTEGGWRIDRAGGHVDADRIGCFGPGGNLGDAQSAPVIHTTFFSRNETAKFLANALLDRAQNLAAINLASSLPSNRLLRGGARTTATTAPPSPIPEIASPTAKASATTSAYFTPPSTSAADTFHLIVLDADKVLGDATFPTGSEKKKVALLYASYAGARAVEPFGLSGGEVGARFYEIIRIHEQIKDFTDRQKGALPSDAEMIGFGTLLFETLFPGTVRRLYDTARSLQLQRDPKLNLVFTSMVSWIAEKPWEFAYDPTRKSFLATEEIHFVRNVLSAIPGDPIRPRSGPLKILVVIAQPLGLAQLSGAEEAELIRRAFQVLIDKNLAAVRVLRKATIPALHGELSTGQWNIVHFIGHGTFDEEEKKGYLIFEDGSGGRAPLDERSAREIFCQRGLDLIFLNACQTSQTSTSDFNKGIAQALVAHGIPALVANQYSVLDISATSFAQFFYWGLASGMTIGAAAREARIAVNYSLKGDPIDWAVPAVYARDPNSSLTTRAEHVAYDAAVASGTKVERRDASGQPIRILVWDADQGLRDLNSFLTKLNNAQPRFSFESIDLSAPLDSFETKTDKGARVRFFRVDRVARRLAGKAIELRANYLLCLTGKPLKSEDKFPGREWISPDGDSRVLVLSYADFQECPPSSPNLTRALAIGIVRLLAHTLARTCKDHAGSTTCSLHAKYGTSQKEILKVKAFDRKCRKALARAIPNEASALDSLLNAFSHSAVRQRGSKTRSSSPDGLNEIAKLK